MPCYKRLLKKGERWFYKFNYKGTMHRSEAIYFSKQEAKKAEADAFSIAQVIQTTPPEIVYLLDIINDRLDYVKSRKSVTYYNENRRYLKELLDFIGNKRLEEISKTEIESLLSATSLKHGSDRSGNYTVNAMIRCYKALFNFANNSRDIELKNPVNKINFYPIDKEIKYIPPDRDIKAVMNICTVEQRLILQFIMDTGARINEALNLKGKDISNISVTLYTRKSKNSNLVPRKVPKPECLIGRIFPTDKNVFSEWSEYPKFLDRKIRQLKQHTWGFHSLRHRRASLWSKEGKPLFEIMSLLGHSQITTTQLYLQMLPDPGDDLVTERLETVEYRTVHRL